MLGEGSCRTPGLDLSRFPAAFWGPGPTLPPHCNSAGTPGVWLLPTLHLAAISRVFTRHLFDRILTTIPGGVFSVLLHYRRLNLTVCIHCAKTVGLQSCDSRPVSCPEGQDGGTGLPAPATTPQHRILEQGFGQAAARSRVQAVGFGIHALAGEASLDGSMAGLKGLNILIRIVP